MPFIFVHGVNVRKDTAYEKEVATRTELLRRGVLEPLGKATGRTYAKMHVEHAYWGLHGVDFAWGNASLPDVSFLRALGGDEQSTLQADAELARLISPAVFQPGLTAMGGAGNVLKAAALKDPVGLAEAVLAPIIFSEISPTDEVEGDAQQNGQLEGLVLMAAFGAAQDPVIVAALQAAGSDEEVIDVLRDATLARLEQFSATTAPGGSGSSPHLKPMGGGAWWSKFKDRVGEIFERAKGAPARAATVAGLDVYRQRLHAGLTQFIGDVFVYLDRRGTPAEPGPIVTTVVDAIRTAPKLEPNEPTIVMTHSMGGNILYDVLTYFAPELAIDVWISVASQVGLFEEMKIFKMSDPAVRAPNKVQTLKPPLKFWLNIYDPADILAFKTAPVFSTADRDLAYRTGDSTFSAHGAYFKRPSFYNLIYEELRKAPL